MKNILLLLGVVFFVTQLMGCAGNVKTQSTQVPVIENSKPVEPAIVSEAPQVVPPVEVPVVEQSLPTPPVPAATANAVASLVKQARAQYDAKNYQAAIATAERARNIDRRSPEVYLVLAQSYLQMMNTQLAQQFLQQGLRYAQTGSDVAQSLMKLKEGFLKN